ncbi:hypothetical protein HBI54_158540 [Parastagonospora nodorum]|nr:hypothetical protein HBI54_158540 [Parastagonospora nodorum]
MALVNSWTIFSSSCYHSLAEDSLTSLTDPRTRCTLAFVWNVGSGLLPLLRRNPQHLPREIRANAKGKSNPLSQPQTNPPSSFKHQQQSTQFSAPRTLQDNNVTHHNPTPNISSTSPSPSNSLTHRPSPQNLTCTQTTTKLQTYHTRTPTTMSTSAAAASAELHDLGQARYDHDIAQATDRDAALFTQGPVTVRQGRAPAGLENQVFAWNTFKYTTEERDDREELKGELHEGQLHRQNRAALGGDGGRGGGGAGMRGGFGGRGGVRQLVDDGKLCAGRKQGEAPPLAKGAAEECGKEMFWDGPIV